MRKEAEVEEIEGEHVGTEDFFFERIGKPIPILASQSPIFQADFLPSQPLAVSVPHGLLFVAHASGFCVARTKDVMDAAAAEALDNSSNKSIQQVSVVDVPVPEGVRILALSADSSTLAVSVSASLHFFSVSSLLDKDPIPSFSCSLSPPSTIKDMRWCSSFDDTCSFLLLSTHGKLLHGTPGVPLHHVLDNVDAVGWSPKGKYVAVAKENILSILSSKFKERLCISLSFESWIGESDDNHIVKVDSINWVRGDSIIVGCFQQTADGEEENYLLQVIRSKNGKISDAASKLVALSFFDLYSVIVDELVPSGTGPYLLSAYLKQCQLAITAHRKNIDQHIVYLGWSAKDNVTEVAAVEIERDAWLPRIELQANGDDNLVLGLCIDEVSLYGKVKVEVGIEEQKELLPSCVLMCVTLEGKLAMFYVASIAGGDTPSVVDSIHDEEEDTPGEVSEGCEEPGVSSQLAKQSLEGICSGLHLQDEEDSIHDEEEDTPGEVSEGCEEPGVSSQLAKQSLEGICSVLHLQDAHKKDAKMDQVMNKELKSTQNSLSSTTTVVGTEHLSHKDALPKNLGVESVKKKNSFPADGQLQLPLTKLYLDKDPKKYGEYEHGHSSLVEKVPSAGFSQVNAKEMQKNVELTKKILHEAQSSKVLFPQATVSRSLVTSSSSLEVSRSNNAVDKIDAANVPSELDERQLKFNDTATESTSVNLPIRPIKSVGLKSSSGRGTIESLPSIHSPQLSLLQTFAFGNNKAYSGKDNYRASSISHSEPNLSRQFGNIKEMTQELDTLLKGIEESGGYREDCTVSQGSSVEQLEEGMGTLFKTCKLWKSTIDRQLKQIHHLFDGTMQVLARKKYLEGIMNQASDSRYWELWDQQRLSSEFELKRQHIVQLNQDLTNQLIELERHFNNLEFQNFGVQCGSHLCHRDAQNRRGLLRSSQPLLSLHTAMNSQLAAAEQLSERLSKQMALLSIELPVRKKNVKKELFETIGIQYDASFSSPDATKVSGASASRKLLLSSGSAATKDHSRRRQLSVTKSSDSEPARRRRVSLDQSLASFEPSKMIVKRVLLQGQKINLSNSSLLMNRQHLGPPILEISAAAGPENQNYSSKFSHPSGRIGAEHASQKQVGEKLSQFQSANDHSLPFQGTGLRSTVFPSDTSLSTMHRSQLMEQTSEETCKMTADISSSHIGKDVRQSETLPQQKSYISTIPALETPFEQNLLSELQSNKTRSSVIKSTGESVTLTSVNAKCSTLGSASVNSAPPSVAADTAAPNQPGKVPEFSSASIMGQPHDKISQTLPISISFSVSPTEIISSSPDILSSLSAPSSSAPTLFTEIPYGKSLTASGSSTHFSQTTSSTSLPSVGSLFHPQTSSLGMPTMSLPLQAPALTPVSFKIEPRSGAANILSSTSSVSSTLLSVRGKTDTRLPIDQALSSGNLSRPAKLESSDPKLQPATAKSDSARSLPLTSELIKAEVQTTKENLTSKTWQEAAISAPLSQRQTLAFGLKREPVVSSVATIVTIPSASGSPPNLDNLATSASNVTLAPQFQPTSTALSEASPSVSVDGPGKNENLDVVAGDDKMEEEAPETTNASIPNFGSLGGFGIGSTSSPAVPRGSPFGTPFGDVGSSQGNSSFTMTVPDGQLFRPASFSFSSPPPSQPSPMSNMGGFSRGFGTGNAAQAPSQSSFGQPAQVGAGQQALGSVLGAFGQSRQIGGGLPSSGFASPTGFGGGFASTSATGGFSSPASGGGFAGAASPAGGFAGLTSVGRGFAGVTAGGGGFAAAASAGGGFAAAASGTSGFAAGGGFAAAASGGGVLAGASSTAGGGFGAFGSQQVAGGFSGFGGITGGSQQGTGGFSAFGGNLSGTAKPSDLFTQMRK